MRILLRLQLIMYKLGVPDGLAVHISAGAAAGLMATLLGSPVDVVKTRVMAARKAAEAVAAGTGPAGASSTVAPAAPQYRGAIDCFVKTLRYEGVTAFYQGVVPQFYRLTGWSIVMFVTFEQIKALMSRVV